MASLYKRPNSPFWWLRRKVKGKWVSTSTELHYEDERETAEAEVIRAKWTLKETKQKDASTRGYDWGWVDQWLISHCASEKTLNAYRLHWRHIRHWLAYAGINHPKDISYKHGHEYVSWRTGRVANKKACSKNGALLEVKMLGQVLRQAALRGEIEANPLQRLGIKKDAAEEKRELTDEEISRCLEALEKRDESGKYIEEEWMRLTFYIGLHTGCRLRETMLVMRHVDFDRRTITYPAPKGGNKKAFTRPLPEALIPILSPLRNREVSHEMPFQPSRCFQNFFNRVGVENVCFHCLRVSYITRLHRAAVPLSAAMRLVNHSSQAVHKIYQRLNVEDVRAYADVPLFSTMPRIQSGEADCPRGENSASETSGVR